jgi:hypothetical protein
MAGSAMTVVITRLRLCAGRGVVVIRLYAGAAVPEQSTSAAVAAGTIMLLNTAVALARVCLVSGFIARLYQFSANDLSS